MNLARNWKRILRKAWSVRLNVLAGLLSALEVILPLYIGLFPRGTFALLSIIVIVGSTVARVVAQKGLDS